MEYSLTVQTRVNDLQLTLPYTVRKVALRRDKEYLHAAFLIQDDQLCFPDFLSRDRRDSVRLVLSAVSERAKRGKTLDRNDLLLIRNQDLSSA